MPHEYAIDTAKRLVKARMWGDLNRAEVLKAALELSADPRLLPGFSELIDLREASATSISAEDVRAIASAPLDPAARRAFVVPDDLMFGLARMFATLRELEQVPEDINVFRKIEEAETWLNLR
jgi:hypothetical protein